MMLRFEIRMGLGKQIGLEMRMGLGKQIEPAIRIELVMNLGSLFACGRPSTCLQPNMNMFTVSVIGILHIIKFFCKNLQISLFAISSSSPMVSYQ